MRLCLDGATELRSDRDGPHRRRRSRATQRSAMPPTPPTHGPTPQPTLPRMRHPAMRRARTRRPTTRRATHEANVTGGARAKPLPAPPAIVETGAAARASFARMPYRAARRGCRLALASTRARSRPMPTCSPRGSHDTQRRGGGPHSRAHPCGYDRGETVRGCSLARAETIPHASDDGSQRSRCPLKSEIAIVVSLRYPGLPNPIRCPMT